MIYRVVCTYHPEVGTFRGRRGAWRVVVCEPASRPAWVVLKPVACLLNLSPKLLIINSTKPRQPNSWCNPRKILAEWLTARQELRHKRALRAAGEAAYEDYCARVA